MTLLMAVSRCCPSKGLRKTTKRRASAGGKPIQQFRMAGDKDDRQVRARGVHCLRQFETVHLRHIDIRDHALDARQATTGEHCCGRAEKEGRMTCGLKQVFERLENAGVVVDHGDDAGGGVVGHGRVIGFAQQMGGRGAQRAAARAGFRSANADFAGNKPRMHVMEIHDCAAVVSARRWPRARCKWHNARANVSGR